MTEWVRGFQKWITPFVVLHVSPACGGDDILDNDFALAWLRDGPLDNTNVLLVVQNSSMHFCHSVLVRAGRRQSPPAQRVAISCQAP